MSCISELVGKQPLIFCYFHHLLSAFQPRDRPFHKEELAEDSIVSNVFVILIVYAVSMMNTLVSMLHGAERQGGAGLQRAGALQRAFAERGMTRFSR